QAQVDRDGKPYLVVAVTSYKQVRVQFKVAVNGKIEVRERAELVPVFEEMKIGLTDPGVTVYGVDGKKLDATRVRLPGPTPVLVSADGNPVDPFYLRLAREGTLVIVAPRNFPGDGPMPLPPKEELPPPKEKDR